MEFLSESAIVASGVVLLVQEILKLRIVPFSFANKYPVPTNIILSLIATFFIIKPEFSFDNLGDLAVQIGTVGVVAAIAWNQLLSKWSDLRSLEG